MSRPDDDGGVDDEAFKIKILYYLSSNILHQLIILIPSPIKILSKHSVCILIQKLALSLSFFMVIVEPEISHSRAQEACLAALWSSYLVEPRLSLFHIGLEVEFKVIFYRIISDGTL